MASSPDVLIVGGGVIGLTTAYFLAKDGVRVEVLDKGELGAEASWAGAGIIPPGNPENATTAYDRLRATSSRMFAGLSAELREATGNDNGYRVCGGIEFLDSEDRETLPAWRSEGIEFSALMDGSSIESAVNLKNESPPLSASSGDGWDWGKGQTYLLPEWPKCEIRDICEC